MKNRLKSVFGCQNSVTAFTDFAHVQSHENLVRVQFWPGVNKRDWKTRWKRINKADDILTCDTVIYSVVRARLLCFKSIEMDCKRMMPKTCSNYHRRRHRDHHHSNVFLKIVFVSCARDASKIFMWMSIKPRCKPIFFHSRMRDYLMCVRCRVVPVCYCVLFFRKRRKNHLFLYVKYERERRKRQKSVGIKTKQ